MMQPSSALLLVASLLTALPVNADGLYTKKSPVLQVTQKNYDQLIASSNYTSIVDCASFRFYAPWCGHCQSLKPAYEKAAKNLEGLAKVAAVNCDEDANKPLCGRMGVQGFPTLKIITPSKKPGKPRVEDYQGARSAKAIVDAVVDKIPNHVKKATDKDLDQWLSKDEDKPRAILFTEKGTISALIKAVAIEFLGSIQVGQIRNKEAAAVEKFGVTQFPTLVLVPGGGKEPIKYSGDLKKQAIVEFLSQAAAPNLDPAPATPKAKPTKSNKSAKPAKTSTVLDDEAENLKPTESPDPKVVSDDATESKPAQVPIAAPPIAALPTVEALETACLTPKSGTCVLALFPEPSEPNAEIPSSAKDALLSLSEVAHKHALRKSKLFPFYAVPAMNSGAKALRAGLGLPEDQTSIEVVAVNARRGWWRRYDASETQDFGPAAMEAWIDAIRLGEGSKSKLPEGIVVEQKEAEKQAEKETSDHDEL
ncbi:putative disulfide isomerase [Aspergillus clavatus NRRL 1]|uniref:protein disulfide-isomerase n=1 Tax=Aspergillus clavatus (strain ATCC 1007 / CBS 513.65 / DSM 816 / NCTC 3887 / NRRL 1 / QM 1276 / 107) TaxID=344612 RepID=A1CRD4_ASPCL|nr:disulfide isomerase, putative [Aspergillus clavatus NRRL 1]EAW08205.1 disulfide isomerase, putative [Aspergillus clavatus NRRL 1]